jgi:hypothetical protein
MRVATFVAVLFCCFSSAHAAEPTALRDARADYIRDVGNIQLDAIKAKEAAVKKYIKKLEEVKKLRTQLGDLDGALAVRDEIELMKAGAPAVAEVPKPAELNLDGEWQFHFQKGYPPRSNYIIKGNRVTYRELRDRPDSQLIQGVWKMVDGSIQVEFDTKPAQRPETWSIGSDGRLYTLIYAPEVSVDLPAVFGVGVRLNAPKR